MKISINIIIFYLVGAMVVTAVPVLRNNVDKPDDVIKMQRARRCAIYDLPCIGRGLANTAKQAAKPFQSLAQKAITKLKPAAKQAGNVVVANSFNFSCQSTISKVIQIFANDPIMTGNHYCDAAVLQALETSVATIADEEGYAAFGAECTASMTTCCASQLNAIPAQTTALLGTMCSVLLST